MQGETKMTATREYTDEEQRLIKMNFEAHVPAYSKSFIEELETEVEHLCFRQPGTQVGYMVYMRQHGMLFVGGDYGSATYRWHASAEVCLDWIADTDFMYFHSKCEASEYGHPHTEWDSRLARENLEKFLDSRGYAIEMTRIRDWGGLEALHHRQEWQHWLFENAHECDLDPFDVAGIGDRPGLRCRLHWLGLRLAMDRLKGGQS